MLGRLKAERLQGFISPADQASVIWQPRNE